LKPATNVCTSRLVDRRSRHDEGILAEWHTDAAVLDIKMDVGGGIELASRLREGEKRARSLVALTGLGTSADVARVKAVPFDHFFLKPVDPDELLRVLAAHADRMPPSA
jgi:CheY-like chemotaxis protein